MLITDYFHRIESRILESVHVVESTVTKDQRSLHIGIIEGYLSFSDGSALHFVEYVSVKTSKDVFKYSYHYQDGHGDLVFRYDMAHHHRDLPTFPHHKHLASGDVRESVHPSFDDVLGEIEEMIG